MTRKINFLPTKLQYNQYKQEMNIWYREKNNLDLHKQSVPFSHYIYVDTNFNNKNVDTSKEYRHLINNKPLYKYYCTTKEAYDICNNSIFVTGEGDVNPVQRFVSDEFADIEFPTDINPNIWFLDIETTQTIDRKFPSFKNNSAEINAITVYDNYRNIYYNFGLIPDSWNKPISNAEVGIKKETKPYGTIITYSFTDPKTLLNDFIKMMVKNTPDIITTWNTKFDIPYIVRKIYDYFGLDGLKKISPFNSVSSKVTKAIENNEDVLLDTLIPGIDVLDLLELYKKYSGAERDSYKLNDIAYFEIGENKIGYEQNNEGQNLFDLYENDYITFMKYNIQDVRLIVLIEEKCKVLKLACAVRNYVKTDYSSIFHETITVDNLFTMEMVRRRNNGDNRVLPSKEKHIKQKYSGAYVKPPIAGRFKWLADCDYTSLYPSITKTFKISNETLVGKIFDEQVITLINIARYYKNENRDIEYIYNELFPIYKFPDNNVQQFIYTKAYGQPLETLGSDYKIKIRNYEILYQDRNYPTEFNSIDELNKWLLDNNFCLLPNGAIIDQSKEDALISKVIADVMLKRTEYKNIMKDLIKESNTAKANGDIELSKQKKEDSEVYDMNQKAVKVINNSVYGTTASENFRLFNLNTAEAITTTGQVIIRNTRYIANKKLNDLCNTVDVDYVVTIDTDSIIFTLDKLVKYDVTERRKSKLQEIADLAKSVQMEVNDKIINVAKYILHKNNINDDNNFLNIKNEWIADCGLFLAKKRYVIHQVFKEGIPFEKIAPTGIDIKRSTTPNVLKTFLEDILVKILAFDDKETIDNIIIKETDKLKNEYSLQEIAIPCGIKDIDSYDKVLPIHVRGAKIWNDFYAPTELDKIVTGKIKYIYVSKWDIPELNINQEYVISLSNDKDKWDMISQKIEVDWKKMKDRLIIQPVLRFYEALNWELPHQVVIENNGVFGIFH